MRDLTYITRVVVPRSVIEEGHTFLRYAGSRSCEGMVLWAGLAAGETFNVSKAIIPVQRGIRTADGVCVVVDGDEMHRINVELFRSGLRLMAQIHSHPTDAYHSQTDDDYAIATTAGSLSLVVPDFARGAFDLSACATYRLAPSGHWQEVAPRRVRELIQISGD